MKVQYITVIELFLICICVLGSIQALDYSDLQSLRFQNCPEKNSCTRIGNASFWDRVCECDSACGSFGDCCIDSRRPRGTPRQECMQYGNYTHQGVFAVTKCPSTFSGPEEVRRQCQNDDFSDPLLSAPVTDTLNQKTYLNRYCALCNDASPTSLKTWVISACKVFNTRSNNQVTWQDITYYTDRKKWGYMRDNQFQSCDFMFDKPESVSGMARPCRANIISSCPSSWSLASYRRACKSYMSVVVDSVNNAYRNPHCALCNDVTVGELMCLSTSITQRKRKPFSFALLLDVNTRDGDVVGVSSSPGQRCASGEKYDPFSKKCRTLVCALPGYRMENGRCVK